MKRSQKHGNGAGSQLYDEFDMRTNILSSGKQSFSAYLAHAARTAVDAKVAAQRVEFAGNSP